MPLIEFIKRNAIFIILSRKKSIDLHMSNLNAFVDSLKILELAHWLFMQRTKEESIKLIFRNGFIYDK